MSYVCPECWEPMQGTVEQVGGIALAEPVLVDGEIKPEYEGETKIDWDSQVTLQKDREDLWMCQQGHYSKASELFEQEDE